MLTLGLLQQKNNMDVLILIFTYYLFPTLSFPEPQLFPYLSLTFSSLSTLSGDLGLRLAGVSYEVNRSADVGASDVPHASEHHSTLC